MVTLDPFPALISRRPVRRRPDRRCIRSSRSIGERRRDSSCVRSVSRAKDASSRETSCVPIRRPSSADS
jgi:hypothetical protein